MRDVLGPGTILGYCTNVHAGETASEAIQNLDIALAVRERISPDEPMGIGWWLSRKAAAELLAWGFEGLPALKPKLAENGLEVFTMNGFPAGDFHGSVVKHQVYEPSWSEKARFGYTLTLAVTLAELSDSPAERSISTLPVGWPGAPCAAVNLEAAASNILKLVEELRRMFGASGKLVHVDLEPEPGCILQSSDDVVALITSNLLAAASAHSQSKEVILRHVRVCHDICHAAVMFEDQTDVLARYRDAGIKVGKVQISNAIRVPFDEYSESERREAFAQLSAFAEDRYLHQTMIRTSDGKKRFFEDLPLALQSVQAGQTARGEWRVHFHVPLFLERFGLIQTTQQQIGDFLRAIRPEDEIHHFETETYAWNVLPSELRTDDLAAGIARELQWVIDHFGRQ